MKPQSKLRKSLHAQRRHSFKASYSINHVHNRMRDNGAYICYNCLQLEYVGAHLDCTVMELDQSAQYRPHLEEQMNWLKVAMHRVRGDDGT